MHIVMIPMINLCLCLMGNDSRVTGPEFFEGFPESCIYVYCMRQALRIPSPNSSCTCGEIHYIQKFRGMTMSTHVGSSKESFRVQSIHRRSLPYKHNRQSPRTRNIIVTLIFIQWISYMNSGPMKTLPPFHRHQIKIPLPPPPLKINLDKMETTV